MVDSSTKKRLYSRPISKPFLNSMSLFPDEFEYVLSFGIEKPSKKKNDFGKRWRFLVFVDRYLQVMQKN